MRLSRRQYVGLSRAQVESLRARARPPVPDADPAAVWVGVGVERMDAAAGASLRDYPEQMPGVRGG